MADHRLEEAVAHSVAYLGSAEAAASLARDPYWPKWNSPWWHALALLEAGRAAAIPGGAARALMEASASHYLPFFPRGEADLPAGKDWYRQVMCHCALGSLLRLLLACGLDGEEGIPWSRGWFARYRLPDGGCNCDELAYGRAEPKSSILSTLPPLEHLLARSSVRPLSREELDFLDGGAAYLLRHRLVCSIRTGQVVRPGWLEPVLPRFYEYDALRGLSFVVAWAEARRRPLARRDLQVALDGLARWLDPAAGARPRRWHEEHETRLSPTPAASGWGPSTTFPLLQALREGEAGRALLEAEWRGVQQAMDRLGAAGLL